MSQCTQIADADLESMDRRSQAAAIGPWVSHIVGRDLEAGLNCIETADGGLFEIIGATMADQDFIANAREDVPKLIAEVRRLRAALAQEMTSCAA